VQNFEHKLKLALMQRHSPVDKWNPTARKLLHEEEQEKIQSRLGGAMITPAWPPTSSPSMQPSRVLSMGAVGGALAASATPPEPDAFDKDVRGSLATLHLPRPPHRPLPCLPCHTPPPHSLLTKTDGWGFLPTGQFILEEAIRDGEATPDTPWDAGRTDGADDDCTGG